MKKALSILAMAEAMAAPFSAFAGTIFGRSKPTPQQDPAESAKNIAAAESKRLRKQQKRIDHAV